MLTTMVSTATRTNGPHIAGLYWWKLFDWHGGMHSRWSAATQLSDRENDIVCLQCSLRAATTVSHWDKGSRLLPTLATLTAWSYRLILDHSDTAQFQIKIRSWFFLNLANYGGLFLTLSHIELTHLKSYWVIQPKLSWVILTLIGMRGDTFISLSFSDQILSANFYSRWH